MRISYYVLIHDANEIGYFRGVLRVRLNSYREIVVEDIVIRVGVKH